jgi:hypothetical protein
MKKFGLLVLGLVFSSFLVACPGGGTTPPPLVANGSPVSGTISNWISGKTGTLYARVFSSSSTTSTNAGVAIAADGSFTNLVLPTPTAAELGDGSSGLGGCSGGTVSVTPSDSKAATAFLTTTLSLSAGSGFVYQANKSQVSGLFLDPGSNNVLRVYASKDTTINGTCTTTTGTPKYTYTYNNVSLAQGWNIVNVSVAPHNVNSTDPILETFTSGAAASDQKFFQILPETGNITQSRSDYAKKLFLTWDAVPDATGYTLEVKSSTLDLGNGVGNYGNPISVTGTSTVVPSNPKTSYIVRVKTKFGTVISYGAESGFTVTTSDLNPDGLNILFPTQGIPHEETIAAGSSKSVNLEFERGANCTQALNLSVSGTSVGAASSGTISGGFTPNNSTGSTSSLALSVGSGVASGQYTVDLNADGCSTSVGVSITLTVP